MNARFEDAQIVDFSTALTFQSTFRFSESTTWFRWNQLFEMLHMSVHSLFNQSFGTQHVYYIT